MADVRMPLMKAMAIEGAGKVISFTCIAKFFACLHLRCFL